MTIKQAAACARRTVTEKKDEVFDFLLFEIIVRLFVLTPLLFLLTENMKGLALLCVPLFLVLVPLARTRAAENMMAALDGGRLFSRNLLSMREFGRVFGNGLCQGLLLLLWASPFIGVTLWLYRIIFGTTVVGQTDVFSVILALSQLGGGDIVRGTVYALLLYLLTLLPFCFGLAFHSGNRFARAAGDRKLVRGKRKGILLSYLRSLLTLVPFLVVSVWAGSDYVMKLLNAVNSMAGGFSIPRPDSGLYIIIGAFVLLLLPLLPLKAMISAAYVKGIRDEGKA